MSNIIHIKSITQAHEMIGLEKPLHPLISVFYHKKEMSMDLVDIKLSTELYFISLKEGVSGSFQYGRSTYDFEEGMMTFIGPHQTVSFSEAKMENTGWSVMFHPDLIRKSELGKNIDDYSFFGYDVNEALFLSDKEKKALGNLVKTIEEEIDQNIDQYTQKLVISNLELLLDYCMRYYDRQFFTRTNLNKDTASEFESFLKQYFKNNKQLITGIPSVKFCAAEIGMSPNYLSDLLKKETGKSALDHIQSFIIEKAKTILLSSNETVSQVAYGLGFEYPQHFSKIFKKKVGISPAEYRNVN